MNLFAINAINAYAPAAAATAAISNPQINGGQVGGASVSGQRQQFQPTFRGNPFSEINEVSQIGASKRANYLNGLGATSNPDNHKLYLYA